MEREHKTWIPFIAVGMTTMLALGFLAGYATPKPDPVSFAQARDQQVNFNQSSAAPLETAQYQNIIQQKLESLANSGSPDAIYQELLDLRVSSEYQELHLELILAVNQWRLGNQQEAQKRLDQLVTSYSWLAL